MTSTSMNSDPRPKGGGDALKNTELTVGSVCRSEQITRELLQQLDDAVIEGGYSFVRVPAKTGMACPQLVSLGSVSLFGTGSALALKDGRIVAEIDNAFFEPQVADLHGSFDSRAAAVTPKDDGPYLALCGPWSDNFYHFMIEYLPKVLVAEKAGFSGRYIIPASERAQFWRDGLRLLGLEDIAGRVETFSAGIWQVREMMAVTPLPLTPEGSPLPVVLRELRGRLLEAAAAAKTDWQRGLPVSENIMLWRGEAAARQTGLDLSRLWSALAARGFEAVVMENLPFAAQIAVAARTRCLVGAHGAGMAHMLFMPAGSRVLECFRGEEPRLLDNKRWFREPLLAANAGLRYAEYIAGSPEDGDVPLLEVDPGAAIRLLGV